jgi:Protein of unknown function (DUF1579)
MRTTRLTLPLTLLLLLAAPARAEAPRPGPEHERLGYFVGKWKGTGTIAENPFMPGGKFTASDTCEWFEGKFAVVCRSHGKGPAGPTRGIGIMSYSPSEKAYLYYGLDNSPMAMATVPRGTVAGDTWTYEDESKMGEQTVKSRYVMKLLGKKAYTFRWEILGPDGQWKTVMEGKSTRA